MKSEANRTQVGGGHYKLEGAGEEHWDRQWRMNGRGYFVGSITKYIERYHLKNGVQDLKKAKHFIEKLIELEQKQAAENAPASLRVSSIGEGAAKFEAVIDYT